ncbi:unnamed protein product [Adineta steineri]|uniref:Poly [ADP-ribose] polymerase n=1 Tax=Adineta steineri TaxID=433720 RepID=A0A815PSQ1_9BILA|nr:unnamed protein product [Adineta steineri]CAF1631235.1 unnamed protein product [Adineta steineri]
MHASNLKISGINYLNGLQLDDLYQLQNELDMLWKQGQSTVSNNLYDKITDSINYDLIQLKTDPYKFAVRKSDIELKKLVDFFTQAHSQGRNLIENSVWDILNQELSMRGKINVNLVVSYPSNWIGISLNELPIQFISLSRLSQEFQDILKFFSQSLGKSSIVIHSIIRIQNLRLWSIFEELKKQLPNNIQRLIHGTASPITQKLIMYHGFYHSFCPGGLIGDGVYFAVNASYSDNHPYVLKKTNHRRELFICQVLLGNSSQGHTGLKSPASGCHSVFNHNNAQNNMFCIFNSYQAYPEYIVEYDYE